jgi:hypothetical protein
LKLELINKRFDTLNKTLRGHHHKLSSIKEILPLETSFEETERSLQSLGLTMEDFHYTGFDVFPYRFYRDVTMMDVFSLSQQEIEMYQLNDRAKQQRMYATTLLKEDHFSRFFSSLDKRLSLDAFRIFYSDIPKHDRYGIFRSIYTKMEYGFKNEKEFLKLCFKDRFSSQEWNEAMLQLYLKLKNKKTITIYRGEGSKSTSYEDAFSWTLDEDIAEFFADRFDDEGKVYKAEIEFENIVDFLESRGEREVLVEVQHLKKITRVR